MHCIHVVMSCILWLSFIVFSLSMATPVPLVEVIKESEKITTLSIPGLLDIRAQLSYALRTAMNTVQLVPTEQYGDVRSALFSQHTSFSDAHRYVTVRHIKEVALANVFVDEVYKLSHIEENCMAECLSSVLSPLVLLVSGTMCALNQPLLNDTTLEGSTRIILHTVVQSLIAKASISIKEYSLACKSNTPVPGGVIDIVLGFRSNGPNNVVNVQDRNTTKVLIAPFLVEAKSNSVSFESNRRLLPHV